MLYSPIIWKVVKFLIFKGYTVSKEFRKCFATLIPYVQFLVSLVYYKSWDFTHINTELLNRKTEYIPSQFAHLQALSFLKCKKKKIINHAFFCFYVYL